MKYKTLIPTLFLGACLCVSGCKNDGAKNENATVRRYGGEHYDVTDISLSGGTLSANVRKKYDGSAPVKAYFIEDTNITSIILLDPETKKFLLVSSDHVPGEKRGKITFFSKGGAVYTTGDLLGLMEESSCPWMSLEESSCEEVIQLAEIVQETFDKYTLLLEDICKKEKTKMLKD